MIIVNKSVAQDSLSVGELKQIFLKKKGNWGGGARIVCINAPENTKLRDSFRSKVLGMSKDEEAQYWQNERIKGKLSPPPTFRNAVKAIFKLRASISYVYRKDLPGKAVKVVAVIK